MTKFKLSPSAELDLLNIALYGMEQFGIVQSEKYRDLLYKQFQAISESPLQYPAVEHIRKGYRRAVCESHSVYYRINADYVEIMRIIGREDF